MKESKDNRPQGFWRRVVDLYVGGFREMTVGRRLWALILVKLAIIFLIFKLFFFRDKLAEEYDTDAERARAVARELCESDRTAPAPKASSSQSAAAQAQTCTTPAAHRTPGCQKQ